MKQSRTCDPNQAELSQKWAQQEFELSIAQS